MTIVTLQIATLNTNSTKSYKRKKKARATALVLTGRSISYNICSSRFEFKILRNYRPHYIQTQWSISLYAFVVEQGLAFLESRVSPDSDLLPNSAHSVRSTYL